MSIVDSTAAGQPPNSFMGSLRTLRRRHQRKQPKTRPYRSGAVSPLTYMVMRESMNMLANTLRMSAHLSQNDGDSFTSTGAKVGQSIIVLLPLRYK